ncbi:MAG: hypothetical protein ABSA18_14660 [Dehalococcoidia bacterium]|jgi:hypothetical protein
MTPGGGAGRCAARSAGRRPDCFGTFGPSTKLKQPGEGGKDKESSVDPR